MEKNTEYSKVLVPIDGSASSFHALEQACQLASVEKSGILAACIAPDYEGDLDSFVASDIMLQQMRRPCEDALAKAKEIAARHGHTIQTVLEEGDPSSRIIEIAAHRNRDLIIMGRRGLSNLERVFVGSVTQRVIGQHHGDVIVVPDNASIAWQKILVATDGSLYSQAAIQRAICFAKAYGGAIDVLAVVDAPAEFYGDAPALLEELARKANGYAEAAANQAAAAGVNATAHAAEGNAYEVIPETASRLGSEIIVVGSHGRTGIRRLLLGSVAEKVIGLARCPVMVVRP